METKEIDKKVIKNHKGNINEGTKVWNKIYKALKEAETLNIPQREFKDILYDIRPHRKIAE